MKLLIRNKTVCPTLKL